MSKCSSCKKDFVPLVKNNGLPYKSDRCRCDDKKHKDTHKEHTKEYGIYYRELNKEKLKEKAKEYFENNKDKMLSQVSCYSIAAARNLLTTVVLHSAARVRGLPCQHQPTQGWTEGAPPISCTELMACL